jgi:hypothetical protein
MANVIIIIIIITIIIIIIIIIIITIIISYLRAGIVTAANSPGLSDGGAALVLVSEEFAKVFTVLV